MPLGHGFTSVVPNGFVFCTGQRVHMCIYLHTRTHTLSFVRMRSLLFLFSVHCVDTIPAFMRLPEPICVPTGAILAQMRPPLGTIWALLKAVSTPPPLSSAHCDQSYLLWRKEELWILSVSLWNSWCFRSSSKARGGTFPAHKIQIMKYVGCRNHYVIISIKCIDFM